MAIASPGQQRHDAHDREDDVDDSAVEAFANRREVLRPYTIGNADWIAQQGWCCETAGGFGAVGHEFGRPDSDGQNAVRYSFFRDGQSEGLTLLEIPDRMWRGVALMSDEDAVPEEFVGVFDGRHENCELGVWKR